MFQKNTTLAERYASAMAKSIPDEAYQSKETLKKEVSDLKKTLEMIEETL